MILTGIVQPHLGRLQLRQYAGPIKFLDHYTACDLSSQVLVAVWSAPKYTSPSVSTAIASDHIDKPAPHLVVTYVDVTEVLSDSRAKAIAYAWQHLQARPDHPGVYGLCVHPEGFKIIYADTSGPYRSEAFSWDDLDVLAMYVYSLYDPPAGHILRDASISTLASEDDPSGPARWSVAVGGVGTYAGGVIHYLGESWGKRTTVFLYKWPSIEPTRQLIIKDYYRLVARRYDEAELLSHIHSQGIVPGVVRLVGTGHVLDAEGKRMMSGTGYDVRERRRLVIADVGEDLLQAKSVNDLLMAIYDVLEGEWCPSQPSSITLNCISVHRTIAQRRNVLHRDMSIYNILLYPKWGQCDRTEFIEDRPPLIKDILGGEMR